jgi:gamma-glutamyltranspeptidase/glutathione hydrolase
LAQRDLAATLGRISSSGRDGFYLGRTAELIEAEMRRGGGLIAREDLRQYEAVWRDPVEFDYRGHIIVSMPPPSSGGATLAEILNILEGFDLKSLGHMSADHAHLWTEAVKLAFVDRNAYLGDPDFSAQPVARMASDAYAAERRALIRRDRATPSFERHPGLGEMQGGTGSVAARGGQHTTHYSVVDKGGTAVAVTTTINSLYGSLVTVGGAGFLLNNEMDDFAAKPGAPNQFGLIQGAINAIAPRKRMLSAMTPTIMLGQDRRVELVTGSPGGPTIITTVAQLISNVVDFEMDLARATAAPRLHHQHLPDVLYFERDGLSPGVVSALKSIGHAIQERPGYQGDTQSITILPDGSFIGMADPRRGGAAVGVRRPADVVQ